MSQIRLSPDLYPLRKYSALGGPAIASRTIRAPYKMFWRRRRSYMRGKSAASGVGLGFSCRSRLRSGEQRSSTSTESMLLSLGGPLTVTAASLLVFGLVWNFPELESVSACLPSYHWQSRCCFKLHLHHPASCALVKQDACCAPSEYCSRFLPCAGCNLLAGQHLQLSVAVCPSRPQILLEAGPACSTAGEAGSCGGHLSNTSKSLRSRA